jgi:hypothetical protein
VSGDLTVIRLIQQEHQLTRRQFVFLLFGQTMLLGTQFASNPAQILAEMAMFPVEALPEDVIMLYKWAEEWLEYATQRPVGPPMMNSEYQIDPPDWYREEWISKEW